MMKNKNGFTLVEVLAVLSVVAVVAIMVMPSLLKSFSNAKKMLNKYDLEGVTDAGRTYIIDLDNDVLAYTYQGNNNVTVDGKVYRKGDQIRGYDLKLFLINQGGIEVTMQTLVKEGYYDKNCHYAGETVNGVVLTKDQNCHMPKNCTLKVGIEHKISADGAYYVTTGYTSKILRGCE